MSEGRARAQPPAVEDPLGWEARMAAPAAVAAILAALLAVASTVVQIALVGAPPDDERETLVRFAANTTEFFLSNGLQLLSTFLLVAALYYLLRATAHRRPETPRYAIGLLVLAPLLLTVGGTLNLLDLNDIADRFLASGEQTNARAEELLEDSQIAGRAIGYGGTLALALSFFLVALNAMRAGLLSKFMGALGMIVGGLLILPLLPGGQGVVQIFWLGALAALFLDRWPAGRGPAWATGEATPWPSAAELRERSVGQAAASGEAAGPDAPAAADGPSSADGPSGGAGGSRPASGKRKRKRKRKKRR